MTIKTSKKLKKKNNRNLGKLPIWHLSDLYNSINSNKIRDDLNFIKKKSKNFEKKYESKISTLDANSLIIAIKYYETINEKIDKLLSFAYLIVAENLNDEKNKIFFQKIKEQITKISSSLIFFTIELNLIKEEKIKELFKNLKLLKYKTWIIKVRTYKSHQLNKDLEKLLKDKNVTSSHAWIRLFDELIASLRFPFKNKKLTSTEILNLLSDVNYFKRREAAKSIGNVLKLNEKIFCSITNNLAKDKSIEDEWRKYPNPVRSRNLSNFVEDDVVESLVSTITSSYPKLSHRYYKMKAKWFGKKKLKYWDRNAPLPFQSVKIYSWQEATDIVLEAFTTFNSEIGKIAELFFKKNWIHAKIQNGKSPGAFSASTVPSVHPYILLNYQGKARDVSTLAHELGHGIHQYLAGRKQTYLNFSTPLTLAETASVFGEMLTFNLLLKNERNIIEKKALLANKVEDMLNTVVRQVAFFEFEKQIHLNRLNNELTCDQICKIWLRTQNNSLGPAIELEKEYKYYWMYIPHFIHSPFYVYAYAFGDCLVNSLFALYEKNSNDFDNKYINLLKSGGSLNYKELLSPFNLNPSNSNFWHKGISVIESFINQLEEIN